MTVLLLDGLDNIALRMMMIKKLNVLKMDESCSASSLDPSTKMKVFPEGLKQLFRMKAHFPFSLKTELDDSIYVWNWG